MFVSMFVISPLIQNGFSQRDSSLEWQISPACTWELEDICLSLCVFNYTWPISALFPHYVSFLLPIYFCFSNFLQPSFCCSTWFSTVSWLACSPWPRGWCCSLWTTMCRGTETVFPLQVSVSQTHRNSGISAAVTGSASLCAIYYSYSHQWDAVIIMHYSCFLYRPVLKRLPVWYQPRSWIEKVFSLNVIDTNSGDCCALVPLTGIVCCFALCLLSFVAGLVIRPNSLYIEFNKSDPLKYAEYVQDLESFLQSKCSSV